MSFRTQALLAEDYQLHRRIAACAAREGISDPLGWTYARAWTFSAQPGWDAAYEAAMMPVGSSATTPGGMDNVITDGMILGSVQAVRNSGVSDTEIIDPPA